jgi:cystathionine beta-synthase
LIADRSRDLIAADETTTVAAAIRLMKTHGISQLPVLDGHGGLHGLISETDLLDYLLNGGEMGHVIDGLHTHEVPVVTPETPVDELTGVLGRTPAAVVVEGETVAGIVTKIDVIDFLASRNR